MSSGFLMQSVESSFTQPADVLNIDGRLHRNATISLLLTATFHQNKHQQTAAVMVASVSIGAA